MSFRGFSGNLYFYAKTYYSEWCTKLIWIPMLILELSYRFWFQLWNAFLKIYVLWYYFYYALCLCKTFISHPVMDNIHNCSPRVWNYFKYTTGFIWIWLLFCNTNDSMLGLKLIFVANWNKFASVTSISVFLSSHS